MTPREQVLGKLTRVPASNFLYAGTVPAFNFLDAGTVPASKHYQTIKGIKCFVLNICYVVTKYIPTVE